MEDALAEIGGNGVSGGWSMPTNEQGSAWLNNPTSWPGLPRALQQFNAVSRFVIPEPTLSEFMTRIYLYDSALALGNMATAKDIKTRTVGKDPASRTIWNYIRRKMHAGLSKPQKFSKVDRLAMRNAAEASRKAAQDYLQLDTTDWFGSAPYLGERSKVRPTYKGLWFNPPGSGASARGLAAMEGVTLQTPTFVVPPPPVAPKTEP